MILACLHPLGSPALECGFQQVTFLELWVCPLRTLNEQDSLAVAGQGDSAKVPFLHCPLSRGGL